VGEAILLGEMLMGMLLDGDEPGDDSKCILEFGSRGGGGQQIVYGVGLLVYVYTLAVRALSAARRVLVGFAVWVFRNAGLASAGSPRAKAGR
jgi:hypothetical protein